MTTRTATQETTMTRTLTTEYKFDTTPVVGEHVTVTIRITRTEPMGDITVRESTSSGIYVGIEASEHNGQPMHMFRDGMIGVTPQRNHGHPVDLTVDRFSVPAVGDRVEFRDDSPQHPANKGIVYVVVPSPSNSPASLDRTHGDDRVYVWLEHEDDVTLAPSRRRSRTGYANALKSAR